MEFTKFNIRDSKGKRVGPGNNIFSPKNVRLNKHSVALYLNDKCAEIVLEQPKFGEYSFLLHKPYLMPKGAILGIFLYENDEKELDIEFGRWGKLFSKNCQFVNQKPFHKFRHWNLKSTNRITIKYSKQVTILKVNDRECIFINPENFKPNLNINLWNYKGKNKTDVILTDLRYKSL